MRLLDLFCGAGGAGMGYRLAGFDVVGVDLHPQPNYPAEFIRADAVTFIADHAGEFDFIHASPPCQRGCALTKGTNRGKFDYPELIGPTRAALERAGVPYVIESTAGNPVRHDLTLCGEMFGLSVIRHRFFEFGNGAAVARPAHPRHRGRVAGLRHGTWHNGPYYAVYGEGGGKGSVPQWQSAMGIHWTNVRREIAEAIPPAYTRYIGRELAAGHSFKSVSPTPR